MSQLSLIEGVNGSSNWIDLSKITHFIHDPHYREYRICFAGGYINVTEKAFYAVKKQLDKLEVR